jgi:membrane dipeptidase
VRVDHVGIGSDFTVSDPRDAEIPPLPSKSFTYPPEMVYYEPAGIDYVKDFDKVSGLPILRTELIRRGFSSGDIAKILGGNWMRVFRKAWNS